MRHGRAVGGNLGGFVVCRGFNVWEDCCNIAPAVLSRDWVRAFLGNLPTLTLLALYVMVCSEWEDS